MALKDYLIEKPVLTTKHLTLRNMTPNDIPDLSWMADKSIYTYWGKNPGKTDKNPELLFSREEKSTKSFHWGIALSSTNHIIGESWVYLIENDRMAKVALRIGKEYQQKGYATEALKEMVRFCFTETELQRLWSDVDVRNTGSFRAMEKCGFTREGMVRQGKMVSTWCDYYLYGILKEDFPVDKSQSPCI